MLRIKTMLFKTVILAAFAGLTIAGSVASSGADPGGQYNEGSDTINSGSGTGGSTDTVTPDTGSSYRNDMDESTGSSTGSGTGGSTDRGSGSINNNESAPNFDSGPNYGTAPQGGPSGDGMGDATPEK